MHRLTFYLLRQLTLAASMTAVGLTFAIWLSQSLRLLDIIVNRGLSVGLALKFLAMLLPSLFALLLPIAVFIAVTVVYVKLESDSELVVMRTAGISNLGIATPAILFGLITTAITYSMTLYAIPASMRSYRDMQQSFAGSIAGVLIEAGVFTDLAPGVTFFAQARDRTGGLSGLIVDDGRDRLRHVMYTAERGAVVTSPEGPRAILQNGTYQETDMKTGQVSVLYFDHTSVELGNLFGHNNGPRQRGVDELFLNELWSGNGASDPDTRWRMRVEAHRRIADPLYCLALALVGAASLLTRGQPRRNSNLQVIIATAFAGLVMVAAFVLRGVSEGTNALTPLIYGLPLLAVGLSLWPLTAPRWPQWIGRR